MKKIHPPLNPSKIRMVVIASLKTLFTIIDNNYFILYFVNLGSIMQK